MGNLQLDCVARSPSNGNKLVGVSITYDYTTSNNYPKLNTVILVESQSNPSVTGSPLNHKDLAWSIIATFPEQYLTVTYGWVRGPVCAISDTGVFTFFAESLIVLSAKGPTKTVPSGFQYFPDGTGTTTTMDPRFGYSGKGIWRNVTVSEKVALTWKYKTLKLFHTKPSVVGTGGGKERLMFVASNTINEWTNMLLGEFNAATGSLDFAGSWSWAHTTFLDPMSIATAGEELYLYGARGSRYEVSAISLQNVSTPAPIVLRTYNASSAPRSCSLIQIEGLHSAVYKDVYYLAYGRTIMLQTLLGELFTIADISSNTSSFTPRANITYGGQLISNFFIPMGGNTPGSAPFAFLQYGYPTRSMPLDGPQAGVIVDKANLTISEPFGQDPNPKKPSYGDGEGGLGSGGVIGIIAALLVFVGAGMFIIRSRKKMPSKEGAVLQGHGASQMPKESHGPDGPNSYGYPPQQKQQWQPSHTLPIAPFTPTAAVAATTQPQTFQDQILGLQFSSHPRPTFVATGGTGEEYGSSSGSTGAGTGATSPVWQPTPFVPPEHPSDSATTPSLAKTSRAMITATNSNTTPAGTPLVPPRAPQIPHATRPQAPQQFGVQDVGGTGFQGTDLGMPWPSPEMGAKEQAPSPHAVVQ